MTTIKNRAQITLVSSEGAWKVFSEKVIFSANKSLIRVHPRESVSFIVNKNWSNLCNA